MLAPGLTRSAQLETLFQVYELGPDVFETRLSSLAPRQRRHLLSALALARAYALHRERAASAVRLDEGAGFPWNLLECLTPEIRCEAREWMGFWAQYRQGHWSEVQWPGSSLPSACRSGRGQSSWCTTIRAEGPSPHGSTSGSPGRWASLRSIWALNSRATGL
jgi:hypothetical protein